MALSTPKLRCVAAQIQDRPKQGVCRSIAETPIVRIGKDHVGHNVCQVTRRHVNVTSQGAGLAWLAL